MKLYKLKNNIYRVNNKTLEYSGSSMENKFTPVEDFENFTVGELLELIDTLGQFEIWKEGIYGHSVSYYQIRQKSKSFCINGFDW